ncbi:MAG: gliding motility-associated protein GldE [Chitinophagaceae bacterium]
MDYHSVNILFFKSLTPLFIMGTELTTLLVILLLLLLCLSFCVAGAEIAFFSLTFKDINFLKTRSQPSYKRVISLLENPKALLASMLIANSLANIGIIVLTNFIIDAYLPVQGNFWLGFGIKVVLLTTIILLVAEILPKVFATQNNIRFAKDVGWVIEGVYLLFNRIGRFLVGFSDGIEKKLGQKTSASSLEELNQAIDLTTSEEATEEEKNILKGIIKFGNITAKQVMKTRLDVSGIDYIMSFSDLKKKVEELHYSRLPVYHETLDEIKGIMHTKDLLPYLEEADGFDWHAAIRPPFFVHEQKMIEDLLQEFQQKHIHFAIVVDEFGGTSGIITLEDIMEEVIGEIKDEFDEEDTATNKIDDLNYIFEGKTMLNDVCKKMDLQSDTFDHFKGESDSLAGLILELAGEIPVSDQVIACGDFDFTVLEIIKNRINKVKITIKPNEE